MFAIFKRKGLPEDTSLPADVLSAIDGCNVIFRQPDGNGNPRVIVQPAGCRGWIHDTAADAAAFRAMWPELSEAQIKRAVRFLASEVARRIQAAHSGEKPRGRGWVHNW